MNLGTFGNRKRTPPQTQSINIPISSSLSGINVYAPKSSVQNQYTPINTESTTKDLPQSDIQIHNLDEIQDQEKPKVESETKDSSKNNVVEQKDV